MDENACNIFYKRNMLGGLSLLDETRFAMKDE